MRVSGRTENGALETNRGSSATRSNVAEGEKIMEVLHDAITGEAIEEETQGHERQEECEKRRGVGN